MERSPRAFSSLVLRSLKCDPESPPGSVMEPVGSRRDGRERDRGRQRQGETVTGGGQGASLQGGPPMDPALTHWIQRELRGAPPAPGQEEERLAGPHGLQEPQSKLGSAVAHAADARPWAGFRSPMFHTIGIVVGFSGDQLSAFTEQPFLCKPESRCLRDSVWRTQPWAGPLPKQG